VDLTDFAKKTALDVGAELVGFTSFGDERIVVLGYPGNGCIDLAELDKKAGRIARRFEELGFESRVISSHNGGGASLRMLAEDAGLGFVGRSGLLITTLFGPRVRLSAVATKAPLAADKNHSAVDGCMGCGICEDACPSDAITHRSVEMCRAHVDSQADGRCTICVDVCPYSR
jgi:epoxyqueuosine reductase QueG